ERLREVTDRVRRSPGGRVWRSRGIGTALRTTAGFLVIYGALRFLLRNHEPPVGIFLYGAILGLLYGMVAFGLILIYRANRITNFKAVVGGFHFNANALVAVFAVGAVVVGLTLFFKFTDIGLAVRASAENADRAALLGIPVKRVSTVVWVIASALAALGVFLRA